MNDNPTFSFHVMVKPHGPLCNLSCKYCFYLYKLDTMKTTNQWRMTDEVLETFIKQYLETHPDTATVTFAWQGGEPTLLGIDFFRNAIRLQKKHKKEHQRIENSFQTNGVLLNEEWAEFFAKHNFLIGISIDGPQEIHDHYRVDKNNKGTFERIMKNVNIMKKHGVQYNALTCVTDISPQNSLSIYRFLRKHFEFIQFIPIVEEKIFHKEAPFLENAKKWDTITRENIRKEVYEWSVSPEGYGDFLCTIFDEWVHNDVGQTFVQIFDTTLGQWAGEGASLCVFSPICGKATALEHDGTLYSCDHFVYPEYRLGNIMETHLRDMVMSPKQRTFGEDKMHRLPSKCRWCTYLKLCRGGCPKNRINRTPGGEKEIDVFSHTRNPI